MFNVNHLISHTKNKYSTDSTELNMRLIKLIKNELSPLLIIIFNRCLNYGIFPDAFNIAKVIPLYKGGDKLSTENNRPISILPQLSKILEKLIKVRFTSYLNKYNIISDSHNGFKANMSTSDALIDTIEFVTDALEKCDKCYIV